MESKEIKSIEIQAKKIIERLQVLKDQTAAYKSGADSFELATEALLKVENAQINLINEISTYSKRLGELDTIKITAALDATNKRIEDIEQGFINTQKSVKNAESTLTVALSATNTRLQNLEKGLSDTQKDLKKTLDSNNKKSEDIEKRLVSTQKDLKKISEKIDHAFKWRLKRFNK